MKKKPIIADFAHCCGHQLFMPFSVPSRNFAPPSIWAPESRKRATVSVERCKRKKKSLCTFAELLRFLPSQGQIHFEFSIYFFFCTTSAGRKKKKKMSLKADGAQVQKMNNSQCADHA